MSKPKENANPAKNSQLLRFVSNHKENKYKEVRAKVTAAGSGKITREKKML